LKREGKLDAILESSPDAITVTDLDGNIVECNQAAVDMHGFESKEKLIGKNAFELIAKKDHKKAIQNLKKTLQLRSVKNVEYACLTKDGREFQAELSASVVRDASGEPEYFMAITKDITERKKTEEALRQRAKELTCLYGISKLVEKSDITLEEIFKGTVNLLHHACQHQDIACVRIVIENKEFTTENFKETRWKWQADIKVLGREAGFVEVCYLEEAPANAEDPSLREEEDLIDAIAERLGKITERKREEEMLLESEERFRAIFEGANDGILVADATTKGFFFANPRICEITGYSMEELLKLGVGDIHPKKDLPRVIDSFTKLVQGKLTLSKDLPVLRKDRRVVYCDISARSVKIGSQEYLIGLFRDVTERKKAEEKINLLSSVVQQALEGIAVSDLDGRILFANSAWLKMHGFDEDEEKDLVGKQVGRFYCRQQVESLDRQVQSGGIFRGRVTQVRKDGTTFPALATLNPLRDENGRVIGIIRMAKILTEIVRDIRDTKSTNASCTEKNMTKGRGL
jgi:PAS domain S-box-containing protein